MDTLIYRPHNMVPPRGSKAKVRMDTVTLKPGNNHLAPDKLAIVKSHPDYPNYVDLRILELVSPESEANLAPLTMLGNAPVNLDAYKVEDAERLIGATTDLKVLEQWQMAESNRKPPRKTIMSLLSQRIADVKNAIL